jgi:hypothetical protein
MSLTLYYHPLASFCHKVLIAPYENRTPFTAEIVDLGNADASARFLDLWPVGKIPGPRRGAAMVREFPLPGGHTGAIPRRRPSPRCLEI